MKAQGKQFATAAVIVGAMMGSYATRATAQYPPLAPGYPYDGFGIQTTQAPDLATVENQVVDRQTQLAQEWARYREAQRVLRATRQEVEAQHLGAPEVRAAHDRWTEARQHLKNLSANVLAKLEQSEAYQQLVERREALKARMDMSPLMKEDRAVVLQEYREVLVALDNAERDAVAADPEGRAAQQAVLSSEMKLKSLTATARSYVDQDPQLVRAAYDLENARRNLIAARIAVASDVFRLAMAHQQFQRSAMTQAIIYDPYFWYGRYQW